MAKQQDKDSSPLASLFKTLDDQRALMQDYDTDRRDTLNEIAEKAKNGELTDIPALMEKASAADESLKEAARAASAALTEFIGGAVPAPAAPKPAPKAGGVRAQGQKPAAKPKPTKPAPKLRVAAGTRNYSNESSLFETVWDALDRLPATYKAAIPAYPDDANGLGIAEMKKLIEHEGKYKSTATNISPMLQQNVGILRHEGKVGRSDDKRYWIVDGAELYGPPLNDDGTAMSEQEDGTFLTKDGAVFKGQDGKPYHKRRKASQAA
jgi:hypothetical protein